MIQAYKAEYIKFDNEEKKRPGDYCVIEIKMTSLSYTHLIIVDNDDLIIGTPLKSITEISGYHRYITKEGIGLGAGKLTPLTTNDDKGMLEGLAKQMNFNYPNLTQSFGKGLLKVHSE